MKCTGEKRREQICREYDIKAIGCYKLFDGREIESDAGVNTIIGKYNTTITKILNDLSKKRKVRTFDFSTLEKFLQEKEVNSNFI